MSSHLKGIILMILYKNSINITEQGTARSFSIAMLSFSRAFLVFMMVTFSASLPLVFILLLPTPLSLILSIPIVLPISIVFSVPLVLPSISLVFFRPIVFLFFPAARDLDSL